MQFFSVEDLKRSYNHTFVSFNGKICNVVTEGLVLFLYSVAGDLVAKLDATEEFHFESIPLGYCPSTRVSEFRECLVYLSRSPNRQFQQGLTHRTLKSSVHFFNNGTVRKSATATSMDDQNVLNMFQGIYPDFSTAKEKQGGGLSKDYGLSPEGHVFFVGKDIGLWTKEGIGLYEKYSRNSIIQQDLADLKIPTIWKIEDNEKEEEDDMDF